MLELIYRPTYPTFISMSSPNSISGLPRLPKALSIVANTANSQWQDSGKIYAAQIAMKTVIGLEETFETLDHPLFPCSFFSQSGVLISSLILTALIVCLVKSRSLMSLHFYFDGAGGKRYRQHIPFCYKQK